ncbi:MAG: ribonuclease HI [Clostridia bacterium]|nr:ribonuclease HI [Clostridia bacterium]
MDEVTLYTDGACSGNPGPGGWCAILMCRGHEKIISGGEAETTNNRMELTAVIKGLGALNRPCRVDIYTDSSYIENAFSKNWLTSWKIHGWKKKDKSAVLNVDLWQELDQLTQKHETTFHLVKGHSGVDHNERCDRIAVEEAARFKGPISADLSSS